MSAPFRAPCRVSVLQPLGRELQPLDVGLLEEVHREAALRRLRRHGGGGGGGCDGGGGGGGKWVRNDRIGSEKNRRKIQKIGGVCVFVHKSHKMVLSIKITTNLWWWWCWKMEGRSSLRPNWVRKDAGEKKETKNSDLFL